ncbi:MAG: oligosaccharide flippase family protein [Deltaproteobacteria bacterium]|nr:oligosaccharide flippase family protein [Deltaproteobacteria bacterium]
MGRGLHSSRYAPEFRKQFVRNMASNIGVFVFAGLMGIWFVPYLIHNLGVSAYGLIPLAVSISEYVTTISQSLNAAVGRFLTIDLEKDDTEPANITFNSALFGNIILGALAFPVVLLAVIAAPAVFHVPPGQELDTRLVFFASLTSSVIITVGSSFSVCAWSRNRFDLRNFVILLSQITRIGIVVLLFSFFAPKLWHMGVAIMAAGGVALIGNMALWRRLTPELHIMPSAFDRRRIRDLFGLGGWMTADNIGSLFLFNVELIVVNRLLGAEMAGKYGSVLFFSLILRNMAATVAGVLTPTIVTKYALGDMGSVRRISERAVKFMGLSFALPVGLLCGFSKPFLRLWLGPQFEDLAWLMIVLLAHLTISLSVLPLFGLQVALERVRWPAVATLIMGLANIVLAVLLVKCTDWGAIAVAGAGAIVLSCRSVLFTATYSAVIQKTAWWTFVAKLIPGILATLAVGMISWEISRVFPVDAWIVLLAFCALIGLFYVILVYVAATTREEKDLLKSLVFSRS